MDVNTWRQRLQEQRRLKDSFFSSHPQSPLPPQARRLFKGLAYWPPDASLCFELALHEYDEKRVMLVADTSDEQRKLYQWGEFRFQIARIQCTLQAYKSNPGDSRLFIPFTDRTTGKESYGAGRYLDLEAERHRAEDGKWTVDFNEAYNPWCAYSEAYACPLVPPENRLPVEMCAGEKKYESGDK